MRTRGGRLLAMYLSVANVLFVGLFLLASPTSALIVEDDHPDDLGAIDIPPVPGRWCSWCSTSSRRPPCCAPTAPSTTTATPTSPGWPR